MAYDPSKQANSGVQLLQPYIPGKPVEELERELGISSSIKLASNENPFGCSALVAPRLKAQFEDLARYPDGSGYRLRNALAENLGVKPEQLTLGNGSNDLLMLLAQAFAKEGDEIIFSEHAFAVYPIAARTAGATPIVVPSRSFSHDLDAMAEAITERTKLVYIANPNNPTGTWLSKGEIKAFMNHVPDHVLVVLDEAYFEYVDKENYPSGVKLLRRFDNLVVTRTFSKIYGLASLRVGYAIASEGIADILNRVRQPFNCNSFALAAAEVALSDQDFVAQCKQQNLDGMAYLRAEFERLSVDYIKSVGNFVCFSCKDAGSVYQTLLQKGVIVRPLANYGMIDYLRVTVGSEAENRRFIEALEQCLS